MLKALAIAFDSPYFNFNKKFINFRSFWLCAYPYNIISSSRSYPFTLYFFIATREEFDALDTDSNGEVDWFEFEAALNEKLNMAEKEVLKIPSYSYFPLWI